MASPITELQFYDHERELAAEVLARMLFVVNPAIDEIQAKEIIEEYLEDGGLTLHGAAQLALIIRHDTIFNPDRDTVH